MPGYTLTIAFRVVWAETDEWSVALSCQPGLGYCDGQKNVDFGSGVFHNILPILMGSVE
jgi:hypothetical protein